MAADVRRSLLKRIFAVFTTAIAAVVGGPIVIAFVSPPKRRQASGGGGATDLGGVGDLPIGRPLKMDIISTRIDAWDRTDAQVIGAVWLTRHGDRDVRALSAVCPHLGCSVGFNEAKQVYACPCHESAFAKADGARIKGPSPRGLDPLPVRVEDGKVFVTYKRFIQGITTRREG